MSDAEVQVHLPLTEGTFLILLSLAPGQKHGYAIMKDVRHVSSGRIVLSTGTLYGAIKRLLEMGWIEPVDDPDAEDTGRPRKAYRLTDPGRRVLDAEAARLDALTQIASARLQTSQT